MGEQRKAGLRCLAVARYMAAAMVGGFAVMTVLAVLTTGGLRPDPMGLLVTQGHILSAQVMWNKNSVFLPHYYGSPKYLNLTTYEAVGRLDLWVSMNIVDDNAILSKNCTITTVSALDMPNAPSLEGMVRIVTMNLRPRGAGIEICQAHAGVLDRWILIRNQSTLDYIAKNYGGVNGFTIMLQVNMTITDDTGVPMNRTYFCWPVTIGHRRSATAKDITCKTDLQTVDYAAISLSLTPPPPSRPIARPPVSTMDTCCGWIQDSKANSHANICCCCFYLPLALFILIGRFFFL